MIQDPLALLAKIADEVEETGPYTAMPFLRDGKPRHYPLAVGADAPRLPAGSVILTGTPDGVALQPPGLLALIFRGILRLQNPRDQFIVDEKARVADPAGYLEPGDRVRASIDGLGAQIVGIVDAGEALAPDPCASDDPRNVE